jgi:hypothetical protein
MKVLRDVSHLAKACLRIQIRPRASRFGGGKALPQKLYATDDPKNDAANISPKRAENICSVRVFRILTLMIHSVSVQPLPGAPSASPPEPVAG